MSSSPPPPPPPAPGGAEPPRRPPLSVRQQWEMSRAGAASGPAVDAARRGLKVRNALTALSIGAVVVGIFSNLLLPTCKPLQLLPMQKRDAYTIHSISQERFLDELERDAEVMQAQRAKPSAE